MMESKKKRKLEKMTKAAKAQLTNNIKKKIKLNQNQMQKEQQQIIEENEEYEEEKFTQQVAQQNNIKDQQDEQEEDVASDKEDIKYDLKYEDDFDDEYEEENVDDNQKNLDNVKENENDWESDDNEDTDTQQKQPNDSIKQSNNDMEQEQQDMTQQQLPKKDKLKTKEKPKAITFLGTAKQLKQGETLEFDNKAYEMLHRFTTEWPCLSCDFLLPTNNPYIYKNPGYKEMNSYPYSVFVVAGTQSQQQNFVYIMKWYQLHKTQNDDDSDHQDSEEEDVTNDQEPEIQMQCITYKHSINRIKSMNYLPIVAFWAENGDVNIMDLKSKFISIGGDQTIDLKKNKQGNNNYNQIQQVNHKVFSNSDEGYALDWSFLNPGVLASGSCDKKIYIYRPKNESFSDIIRDNQPYLYHQGSVEDIQWSPKEVNQFASCSVDKTVQIGDLRADNRKHSQLLIKAHNTDVNVISWCRENSNLIASGADDGGIKVWDIRYPQKPYTEIDFHKEPITSIQFQPNSDSIFSTSCSDDRLTIWDLAVENDDSQVIEKNEMEEQIPDHLMFIHQGQQEMKELKYHPIYYEMIMSTANDGFHLFKPALDDNAPQISSESEDEDEKNGNIPIIKEKDLDDYLSKLSLNDK